MNPTEGCFSPAPCPSPVEASFPTCRSPVEASFLSLPFPRGGEFFKLAEEDKEDKLENLSHEETFAGPALQCHNG